MPTQLDLNAPLRWEHIDGTHGDEVIAIPRLGDVLFSDALGAVARVKNVRQSRWWVIIKILLRTGHTYRFRVTSVERYDDTFVYIIPWVSPQVVHCTLRADHDGCEPWSCGRVRERVHAFALKLG